jgi:hypothetical protein
MLQEIIQTVKTVSDTLGEAKEFLGKIASPPAEEFGLFLGDEVRFYRFKKQVKLLTDAQEILKQAGIDPKKVPLKTLCPILEGAALEEDESMSARWAALLATAANPKSTIVVQPSFPEILKQLSPLEAKILDLIFDMINQIGISRPEWSSRGAVGKSVRDLLHLQEQDFEIAIDNLYRLRLCSSPSTKLDFIDNKEHRFQLSTKELICITELGYSFVSACKNPSASKPSAVQDQASEHAIKLAKDAIGAKFRGEYSPAEQYEAGEVVFISAGLSAGTFLCIKKPPIGTPPYLGGGYFISFPSNHNGNVWM